MKDTVNVFLMTIGGFLFIAALLILPVYFLWNWLMPIIFGLPELTLWQALGINLLSGLLFGSKTSSRK